MSTESTYLTSGRERFRHPEERIVSLGPVLLRNVSDSQGTQLKPTKSLTGSGPEDNAIGRGSNVEEDQKDQKDQKDQNKKAEKVELGREALECQDSDKDQMEVVVVASHPHHIFEQDGQARSRK